MMEKEKKKKKKEKKEKDAAGRESDIACCQEEK